MNYVQKYVIQKRCALRRPVGHVEVTPTLLKQNEVHHQGDVHPHHEGRKCPQTVLCSLYCIIRPCQSYVPKIRPLRTEFKFCTEKNSPEIVLTTEHHAVGCAYLF